MEYSHVGQNRQLLQLFIVVCGNLLLHGLTFDSKQPVKHVNLLKVILLRKINKIQIVTFVLLYYIIWVTLLTYFEMKIQYCCSLLYQWYTNVQLVLLENKFDVIIYLWEHSTHHLLMANEIVKLGLVDAEILLEHHLIEKSTDWTKLINQWSSYMQLIKSDSFMSCTKGMSILSSEKEKVPVTSVSSLVLLNILCN